MTIRHLPAAGYAAQPWKNGTGTTDEICLLPPGAGRDAFTLRISRATIAGPGPFSAFPGVERVITVIEGRGLMLDFGSYRTELAPWQPYAFDSGLTPDGVPRGGTVRVVNVMALRQVWRIGPARVVAAAGTVAAAPGGLTVVFALQGRWRVGEAALAGHDTALVAGGPAQLVPDGPAAALLVPLSPA